MYLSSGHKYSNMSTLGTIPASSFHADLCLSDRHHQSSRFQTRNRALTPDSSFPHFPYPFNYCRFKCCRFHQANISSFTTTVLVRARSTLLRNPDIISWLLTPPPASFSFIPFSTLRAKWILEIRTSSGCSFIQSLNSFPLALNKFLRPYHCLPLQSTPSAAPFHYFPLPPIWSLCCWQTEWVSVS